MTFPATNTQEGWDKAVLMGLSIIQEGETSGDREEKARRMRKIFKRSQIGATLVLGARMGAQNQPELEPRSFQVLAAQKKGLTVLDTETKEELVLDYRNLRVPVPRGTAED